MPKIILIGSMILLLSASPVFAGSDKLAKIMGFGGVCADCNLSKKDLSNARMNGVSFPRANFTGTDLSDSKMTGSNFNRAAFRRADLSDVKASGSNFSWADFSGATLDDIQANGCNFSRANFTGMKGRDAEFYSSNLSHSNLLGASLIDAEFETSNLSHTNFSGAKLRGVSFTRSNLAQTNMQAADLRETEFDHVDFRGAQFGNAILSNAVFDQVFLSGADLSRVRGLTQNQLKNSCGNQNTKLPANIKIKNCSSVEWADDFSDPEYNVTNNFSFNIQKDEYEKIREEVKRAITQGHESLAEVQNSFTFGLGDQNSTIIHFEWNQQTSANENTKAYRSQRSLERTIRSLARLELSSSEAQNEIDFAIMRLEQAKAVLAQAQQDQE
ncbi:MAG: pentapeptide repeat-containing protein [Robiginitomaculum sp.]|nr:pentapeptide repeat-containing protein [Robiginitomaculum sp.]